jgi:hypothetical protein
MTLSCWNRKFLRDLILDGYLLAPRFVYVVTVAPLKSTANIKGLHVGNCSAARLAAANLWAGSLAKTSTDGPAPETTAACPELRRAVIKASVSGIALAL